MREPTREEAKEFLQLAVESRETYKEKVRCLPEPIQELLYVAQLRYAAWTKFLYSPSGESDEVKQVSDVEKQFTSVVDKVLKWLEKKDGG